VTATSEEATQKVGVIECQTTSALTSGSAAAGRSDGSGRLGRLGRNRVDSGRADGSGLCDRGLYRRDGSRRSRNFHRS